MLQSPHIEVLLDIKTTLGEGPIWDAESQRLHWIDSADGRIFRATHEGRELRSWDVGEPIGSMAVSRDGSFFLAALKSGLHRVGVADGVQELIINPEPDLPHNRLNDGKVDRQGRFVFGSMDTLEEQASGKLYSYTPEGELNILDSGIVVSNGPCFSPDGRILYFADTWTGLIWAYDYDPATGQASNRRTFATVDTSSGGAADGATVDAEGYLWQALVYGGKIIRYAPDGTVDRVIQTPVLKVTSLAFGGPDLDTLFVTSMARPPLPRFPQDGQQRGSLFAVSGLGVHGLPEPRFGA
ncbi:SMP-30/gluconolactonase/LRE family protein [Arthrobacter citreus]|uniref:SMP-30/gluconolactonase/LRE family protein n=1 Tax=Arthrobacter citreus TaxID=1670 RepID=A0ABZ2ZVE5_9MICC